MEHYIKITLIGLFSGIIGTGTGGLAAFSPKGISKRTLGFVLEFSAGLMTSVVCFELVPEAFELSGIIPAITGLLSGILVVLLAESFAKRLEVVKRSKNRGLLKAGILMSLAIAIHNFPEGFAVGSGFEASSSLGLLLTFVIGIHDIPEGIAMVLPMRAGGVSSKKAFAISILSGMPMGLGALLGAVLGGISDSFISSCLGFAGGAMLYIVFAELVPESKRLYSGRFSSFGNILGILCGIIVVYFS